MTSFTTKKVSMYGKDTEPSVGVSNAYDNVMPGGIDGNCLCGIYGLRHTGKTFLCSKIVNQAQKTNVYDRIYIITPTWLSNKSYFGKHINIEDVFEPNRESIKQVIESVEADRDEFEEFLEKLEDWKAFKRKLKSRKDLFSDYEIFKFTEYGWFDDEDTKAPVWKYKKLRPPQSLLILDDVLGTQVVHSPYFTRIGVANRHQAGLKEPYGSRTACGLGVIFNSQRYSMQNGISSTLRENQSHMIIFKNKQRKQLEKMVDEMAGSVDEDKFMTAYEYAIQDKHDSLLITFKPHCPTHTFKRNLNELIIFPDAMDECNCNK